MQGIIEIHGAKQVLNTGDQIYTVHETCFIPGDIAVYNNGKTNLVQRIEQKVIAVVQSVANQEATLYILNFGPNCPFRPKISHTTYIVGDRLVLHLNTDGTFVTTNVYSNAPIDDVKCLLDMYSTTSPRPPTITTLSKPLYTKATIVNHNDLNTFTIDPTHSVDFDDALSVDPENNTVYVHIVDIANQPISENSQERLRTECLTLYLANEHTEHLLDTDEAAFGLSLVVGHERPVITVKIVLDTEGCVTAYDIYRSTIVVKNRYDYETVSATFTNSQTPKPEIAYLANLTEKRNSSAVKYNISLPSLRVLSDCTSGEVTSIKMENTNDIAHTLVATAMILANLTVSKHISDSGLSLPNRFHESLHGIQTPPDYVSTGNPQVDSFILVKRYARAFYAVDKKGHFGLGLKDYVHFTSPMRRYADVIVHMILAGHTYQNIESEVDWLNRRATLVRTAQDIYLGWKKTRYLKSIQTPTTQHDIWVTGISKGGILWFMPSLSFNGFIHVSLLKPTQYWIFSDNTLRGSYSNTLIKVGDKLSAFVENIDEITGEIKLRL